MESKTFQITASALRFATQLGLDNSELRKMKNARPGTGPNTGMSGQRYYCTQDVILHVQTTRVLGIAKMTVDSTRRFVPRNHPRYRDLRRPELKRLELREYQQNAIASMGNETEGYLNSGIDMRCGSGKTHVGAEVVRLGRGPALINTLNRFSVDQWESVLKDDMSMQNVLVVRGTGVKGWLPGDPLPDAIVCTYALISEYFYKFITTPIECTVSSSSNPCNPLIALVCMLVCSNKLATHICDEYHTLPAKRFQYVCYCNAQWRVGMTGTLIREDSLIDSLTELVGPVRYTYNLVNDSSVDIDYKILSVNPWPCDAAWANICKKHFIVHKAFRAVNPYKMHALINDILSRPSGERTLVYCDVLLAIDCIAMHLKSVLPETQFLILGPLQGSTSALERSNAISKMNSSDKSVVLVTSKILDQSVNIVDPPIKNINQMVLVNRSRMQEEQRIGRGMRTMNAQLRVNTFVVSQSNETQFATWRTEYIAERQQKEIRCEDVTESHSSLNNNASFALTQLKSNVQQLLERSQLETVQNVEGDECEVGANEDRDLVIHEEDAEELEEETKKKSRKRRLIDTVEVQPSTTKDDEHDHVEEEYGFGHGFQEMEDSDCSDGGDETVAPFAKIANTQSVDCRR